MSAHQDEADRAAADGGPRAYRVCRYPCGHPRADRVAEVAGLTMWACRDCSHMWKTASTPLEVTPGAVLPPSLARLLA